MLPYVNEIEDEIIKIFNTDDGMWKYWTLRLISRFPGKVSDNLLQGITRMAEHPTEEEIDCEVQQEATEVLQYLNLKR